MLDVTLYGPVYSFRTRVVRLVLARKALNGSREDCHSLGSRPTRTPMRWMRGASC
jgi:hypothetical protein